MFVVENDWKKKKQELNNLVGKKFHHSSPMQTTTIEKIVINSGVGSDDQSLKKTKKLIEKVTAQLAKITKSKEAVKSFNIRAKGIPTGCMVTLRKERAWRLLFALIHYSLPRLKGFKGLSPKGFDQNGNYNLGIKDWSIFLESSHDLTDGLKNGFNVSIVFSSDSIEENKYYLESLKFPFKKE